MDGNGLIRDFEPGKRDEAGLDLAFLHADPYVFLNKDKELKSVPTLSPDIAFEKLETELKTH